MYDALSLEILESDRSSFYAALSPVIWLPLSDRVLDSTPSVIHTPRDDETNSLLNAALSMIVCASLGGNGFDTT
jgi:hypothetical protein